MKNCFLPKGFLFLLLVLLTCLCYNTSLFSANYYWVNGNGNWSDYATHWAKNPTPLGMADYHVNVPTASDDVFFGNTHGGAAYTVNVDAGSTVPKCRNMDWTGVVAGTVWGGGGGIIDIYGSATLNAGMGMTYFGQVHFISNNATTKTITSNTIHFSCAVYFEGTMGGWQLADAFYCDLDVNHTGGLLETMGQTMTIGSTFSGNYSSIQNGILHLGSSEMIISGSALFKYAPAQFDAGTSHIKMMNANTFLEGPLNMSTVIHFYNVTFFSDYDSGGFAWANVDGTLTFHGRGRIHGYSLGNIPVLNNVIFYQNAHIYNAFKYNHLTLSAGKTYTVENYSGPTSTDQTILAGGTLTALGAGTCSQFIALKSWQYGTHFNLVNNSGSTQTMHCAILEDCHAIGSDPLEVLDGVNLGNNTGWIFTNPNPGIDLYWVGGAGDWNDPCHWTTNPTGTIGNCNCIPTGATNVFFTANSGFSPGDKVTVSADAYCANMDWAGVTGEPEIYHDFDNTVNLHIYGSVKLSKDMNFNFAGVTRFRTSNISTITSASNSFKYTLVFEGTGTWELQDTFKQINYSIYHERGVFKTLGHTMEIYQWLGNWLEGSSGTRVNMGAELFLGVPGGNSSNIHLIKSPRTAQKGEFRCFYEASRFYAIKSHIIGENGGYIDCYPTVFHDFWDVTFNPIDHAGDFLYGNIKNKLIFLGGANLVGQNSEIEAAEFHGISYIFDNHTYKHLTIYGGKSYKFDGYGVVGANTVQTISATGTFNIVDASCEKPAYLFNATPEQKTTIRKEGAGTPFNIQNAIFDEVYPDQTTGAIYTATNCIAIQSAVETAWNITNPPPRTLHWVGGAGDWHSAAHWSLAAGGAGGECPPTPHDDVFFDSGSGFNAGDRTTISQKFALCKNMDWTGVGSGAVLDNTAITGNDADPFSRNNLSIFGNLTFANTMVNNFQGSVFFRASQMSSIASLGQHFKKDVFFWSIQGDWTLSDALYVERAVYHHYGKLRSGNQPISVGTTWYGFTSYDPLTEFFLGSSTMRFTGLAGSPRGIFGYDDTRFHAGTSHIIFEDGFYGGGELFTGGTNPQFYNITFKGANSRLFGGGVKNKLLFEKSGSIESYTYNLNTDIQEVEFYDDAKMLDNRKYHSMKFAPGKRYTFAAGSTQTLVPHNGQEGQFIAQGLPGQYIEMKSSDPNTQAIIHMDDYNGTSTCTKYLFLTGMKHTGTEEIYVPTPGGNVFNNVGWQFFPCNPCPASIPTLDPSSITSGCAPGKAKLVLAGLKPDEWAIWYADPAATANIVYNGGQIGPMGNMFTPDITGPTTYYARVYSDGGLCESTVVLTVNITTTTPPTVFNLAGGGQVCTGSIGVPISLNGSEPGVAYALYRDGLPTGTTLIGTGNALSFGLQTVAGAYTVVATPTGAACPRTMNGTANVTGSQDLAPTVMASSNAPLCAGNTLQLNETGGEATSWAWTGPGGFTANVQSPMIMNADGLKSGIYTVIGTSPNGCQNQANVYVFIFALPNVACPGAMVVKISDPVFALSGAMPTGGIYSGQHVSNGMFDPFSAGLGQHTVYYTFTDDSNCSNECSFSIAVQSNLPPTIQCPIDVTVGTDVNACSAIVSYPLPVAKAEIGIPTLTRLSGLSSGAAFPLGTTVTVWRATDLAGLTATCSFAVTVKDLQPPAIVCPANIMRGNDHNTCGAVVVYANATATDNCGTPTVVQTSTPLVSGSTFPVGTTTVVFRANDAAIPSNSATCSFSIVVLDAQAPNIACPPNQSAGTIGTCNAIVHYNPPVASDNCGLVPGSPVLQSGLASGVAFPLGLTTVVWRATDQAGLTGTCSFRVIVLDGTPPTITCPNAISVPASPGTCAAIVTYPNATAADNCTANPVVIRLKGPASNNSFPVGNKHITFRATDGAGRNATCSFLIKVLDTQLPVVSCPNNVAQNNPPNACIAPVVYPNASATDNCGVNGLFLSNGLASGSVFPLGITTNMWQAIDNNGLTNTCSFTVTILCNGSANRPSPSAGLRATDKFQTPDFQLSPNPAQAEVSFDIQHLGDATGHLLLFDALGRLVWRQSIAAGQTKGKFDVSPLPNGLYHVCLLTARGVATRGLVVSGN